MVLHSEERNIFELLLIREVLLGLSCVVAFGEGNEGPERDMRLRFSRFPRFFARDADRRKRDPSAFLRQLKLMVSVRF